MSCLTLKSVGRVTLAAALAFAFTPFALAAEFNGQANVVPNPNAAPRITAKVDPAKLAALKLSELPDGAKDLGRMDGNHTLTLELRLSRTHVAQSAALALRRQVQDPTSPWYGKTVTPAEFAENFGLAGSDLDALTNWLKAQGFEVGNVDNGRMVIGFSGTVAQVETAFHTELHNYAAKDGSQRFAPAMALQIPYAFHAVLGYVAGVENFRDYRAATFPGPVTDFMPGAANAKVMAETSGTSTPKPDGELLHDSSFTAGSYAIGVGGHTTLNVRLGGNTHPATGSLTIVDESTGNTVAHIADITACTGYNGGYGHSCTINFAPKGAGTAFLKAVYSGDEHERGTVIGYNVISFVGTQGNYSTVTISSAVSTYMVYPGAGNTTFASNIYYAGAAGTAATAPTGTYALDYYDINSTETIIVAAANLTGCTTTTATHNVSCSNAISGSTLSSDSTAQGLMQMDVVYSGDANYASTANGLFGYDGTSSSATFPTSITLNGSFTTTHTYGASASDSGLTSLTLVSPASPSAGYTNCSSIDDILGGAQVGLLAAFENAAAKATITYTISFSEPAVTGIPAQLTPGTYAVSALYTGDHSTLNASCTYGPLASASSVTLTEAKQAPTVAMTTPTTAAPVTQLAGGTSAFTVTGTLAWTGTGIAPDPTKVSFTTTDGGTFGAVTCTAANSSTTFPTSPYTCSATFTPNAADAAGNYNLNLSFATDTNYLAAATAVTANYIVASDTMTVAASPTTEVYGSNGTTTITATLSGAAGATGNIALSYTDSVSPPAASQAITTVNLTSCTTAVAGGTTVYTCPFVWTPPATATGASAGTLTIKAAYTGSLASVNATTTYTVTKATPSFGTMSFSPAATEAYGTSQAITISDTLIYSGVGLAPSGAVTYVLNGVTYTAACTGSVSPLTCTATVPAGTIAALPVNTYTVTAAYATDINYAAATGTSGTFTITKGTITTIQMTTSAYTTPPTATTEAYGAITAFTVYATLSPVGTVGVTAADVVFSTSTAGIGTFGATTCAVVSGVDQCHATFTPNGMAGVGSYNINVSFTGDANYNSAGPSTNGTGLYVVTIASPTLTLSPSPITALVGSVTPITITATATISTGTVNFTGTYATYGTLSATSCTLSAGSCTVSFTPNGTTAAGTYPNILTATLAATANNNSATANDSLFIGAANEYTALAVTINPIAYFDAVTPGSITAVLSWTNPAVTPSGTITFTDTTASNRTFGVITLSPTGAAIAAGTGCTTAGSVGTCTYSCNAMVDLAVSCTLTNTAASGKATTAVVGNVADGNAVTASYSGNTFFSTATGNTYLYNQSAYAANGDQAMIMLSGTAVVATSTYGLTQAESPTVTITDPDGTPPSDSTFPFLDITSTGQTGTMYEINLATCANPCATVTSWTFPAVVAPGTYSLSYNYSGNYQSSNGDADQTTFTSGSVVVSKQTPTFPGTMTFSPAATEPYATSQAITISDTLKYLGIGEAPQGAVTYTLNGVGYVATCGAAVVTGSGNTQSNVETCTATVPAATIAALAVNTYTVTVGYTADTNYGVASGTSGTFTISTQTPTVAVTMVSPSSETYGALSPVSVTATLTYTGAGTAPTGTPSFTSSAAGPFGTPSCGAASGDVITCTVTFTPTATDAVGNYYIEASYSGDTNYAAANSGTTNNFTIGQQTPVVAVTNVSPSSEPYGSGTAVTVTATLTYTGSGAAPTGTPTFTSSAGGTFGTPSCGAPSGDVITCTVTLNPTATDAVGNYYIEASYTGDTNYAAANSGTANNFAITTATATLAMVAGAPGTTSAGVTTTTLTATLSPAASGSTVTFTDVTTAASPYTIGTAMTNASGVATITVNTAGNGTGQSSKPSGGKDLFSASATATSNTAAASTTSNTTTYFQGILFSFIGTHNFSGGLTGANDPYSCCAEVEGTVDGTTGAAYGVSVFNFTSSSQSLPVTLTNSASQAFSLNNQCGATLSSGESCTLVFNYAPPAGDGCTPVAYPGPPTGNQCTFDSSNFPQGTYETATWTFTSPMGVLTGLGNLGFTASGNLTTTTGTLAGKALLTPVALGVSPLTAAFGNVAQGSTSQTITVTVTNSSSAAVGFVYTAPSSGNFTANNTCASPLAAMSSCSIFLNMVTTSTGTFTDSLTIAPTGGTSSTVNLSGTVAAGSTGITLSSNNHNFGSVTDGTSVGFTTTLTNNTGSAAMISFSNSAGAGYTTSTTCTGSLAASASCTYSFTFAPTTPGASNDTLTITSSVPILPGGTGSGPYTGTVTTSGTGVAGGRLTATSVTHNFGSIAVGTSGGNYGLEITNSTSAAVTLSYSGLTGGSAGFSIVGTTCGASLAVNANCEMVFSFKPTGTGFVTGTYPITSSSPLYFAGNPVSPSQITLEGTGN